MSNYEGRFYIRSQPNWQNIVFNEWQLLAAGNLDNIGMFVLSMAYHVILGSLVPTF